jgi:Domain of unknown function (DUF4252)
MKNSIIVLIAAFCFFLTPLSISAQTDAITQFCDKYMDDENFTLVYITPKMFQLISKIDLKDPDARLLKDALQDLRGLRILSTEKEPMKYYKELSSKFNASGYELLMTVRDGNENVRFWTKESNGIISELLMLVSEPTEFTVISFIGKIDLDKISRLANNMKFDGSEHLNKLKEKDKPAKEKTKGDEKDE